MELANYLFGIGVAIAGIGITLMFQGLVLVKPQDKVRIGKMAWFFGIAWVVMGLIPLVLAAILRNIA